MQALVVDDSRAMRCMLGNFLREMGFAVAEAGDGQQALEQLKIIPTPELMLIDWNMPVMDGWTLLQAVRADSAFAESRVMVTTETDIDRMRDALDAGADEYMMKPFTKEALIEKVKMLHVSNGPSDGD